MKNWFSQSLLFQIHNLYRYTPASSEHHTHLRPTRTSALILGEPLIRDARREQFLPLLLGNRDKEIYIGGGCTSC